MEMLLSAQSQTPPEQMAMGMKNGQLERGTVRRQLTHDMIIDYLLANPTATYLELGAEFGYTKGGIAVLIGSDAFQARYAKRRSELVDPLVAATIEERLVGLAHQSITILSEKLEASVDGKFALQVLDSTTRAAGYGAKNGATVNTQFVVHLPGPASSTKEWSDRFGVQDAPVLKARVEDAPAEGVKDA